MTCQNCNGTGSLSKHIDGSLDCPCGAADERAALEQWTLKNQLAGGGLADAWLIYQHGKAAAAAKPAASVAPAPAPAAAPTKHVPQPRMVDRKCNWCKGSFQARAADVARGWGKFCSKSCKASRQEKSTGQYRNLSERDGGDDGDDECGHIFASGYFGHGQE